MEPLKTRRPKNRPTLKKLTNEWSLQNRTEQHQTRTEGKMATGNEREVTWYFRPSQPVPYEGSDRVTEVLYKEEL